MEPVILFREDKTNRDELNEAHKFFTVHKTRGSIPNDKLVIGRYSVLPYYKELSDDLDLSGSELINTYTQHRYIANLGNWYRDLEGITPKTWPNLDAVDYPGSVILKGETNSKKFQWDTHMFAANATEAGHVLGRLMEDGLVGDQQIYVRKFEKLKTYFTGYRNMPVTHEFRIFVCDGWILTTAFYWSNYVEEIEARNCAHPWPEPPSSFIHEVIERVGKNARFYVIDVGLKENNEWTVIELNDGQMSGLSMTDPALLYKNLREVLAGGKT